MARNPNISATLREKAILAMGSVTQTDVQLGVSYQGQEITPALRDELLQKCAAGQYVEIELSMLAYEQKLGERNRNNVRLRDGAIMKMAQSCVGRPFLKDHQQHDSEAVQGIITNSAGSKLDDGHYKVNQKVSLRDPKAVARALRGLMSTVSISWRPTGDVCCSVCNTPVFTDCYHFPGDKVREMQVDGKPTYVRDRKNGNVVVEWVYNDAEGLETSEVPVPAVKSAKINDIRAQINLAAGLAADDEPDLDLDNPHEDKTEKNAMDPKDKEIADLKALNTRLSAIASLSGPEKAHFDRLGSAAQDTFLGKSVSERADMTKVIHTDRKGRVYFASDDSRLVELAKDGDEAYEIAQKQVAAAKVAGFSARASTELAHLSGTIEQRTALLAAVESISEQAVREACLKMIQEVDTKQARFFTPAGRGQTRKTVELGGVDPDQKLEEMAQKMADESDDELTVEQAYEKIMETKEGERLYAESEARKSAARGN